VETDGITLAPTVWTGKGNTPKLLKNFKLPGGYSDMDQFTATETNGLPKTGKLYFHVPGSGLWMTYGKTPLSLGKFDDVKALSADKVTGMISAQAESVTPAVYFGGWSSKKGQEPYSSEGTVAKTKIVDDIATGAVSSSPDEFVELMQGETSTVFFRATPTGSAQPQIWQANTSTLGQKGTVAQASPVLSSTLGTPQELVTSTDIGTTGGCYFVMPTTNSNGVPELWSTTGAPGTAIALTSSGAAPLYLTEFPANGDSVLFSGSDSVNGRQIWEANSLIGGGALLDIINPNGSANPVNLTAAAGEFYYAATAPDPNSTATGQFLFVTDGNPGDSVVVQYDDDSEGFFYTPANPREITPAVTPDGNGSWVYFIADGTVDDASGVNFQTGALWAVPNDGVSTAVPVEDANGNVITGAHNLKAVLSPSAAGVGFFRLYFSRDIKDGHGPQVWETE
jgi:ELWxxDGT repeat protein